MGGVLLWTPSSQRWYEVSVMGNVYSLRPEDSQHGSHAAQQSNVLMDGSLISVGGITFIFRTFHGPTQPALVVFPACGHTTMCHRVCSSEDTCPTCGRVGQCAPLCATPHPDSGQGGNNAIGFLRPPFELGLGTQMSSDAPTHVFNRCGHSAPEDVCRFWASVPIPDERDHIAGFWCNMHSEYRRVVCPMCGEKLDSEKPYSRLMVGR
eukprot:NODE_957_length_712_cov_956.920060_g745_i0.p1 GENE.NODE_957_length_712_cov_956.920060_g745_i0~~NODE_957_length_712_cov_956.920060_g745_i0.p1  ORF type:complete len:208 (+),score=23.17 NODE_957_length_712_cov_956.920060_g745_i0:32-655(+)